MDTHPRIIKVKAANGNIKNIQEYEHNEQGHPVRFKKYNDEKVLCDIYYTYEYYENGLKKSVHMEDKVDGRITIMEYEY